MSISYFENKGYIGSIEPDIENNQLFGKILFIRDLITYEAGTFEQLESEFRFSVDEYLADCKILNKQPEKLCSKSDLRDMIKMNSLLKLEVAVKDEANYSELLKIIYQLIDTGTSLSSILLKLRELYPSISEQYDDELGDLIQDIEHGKYFK